MSPDSEANSEQWTEQRFGPRYGNQSMMRDGSAHAYASRPRLLDPEAWSAVRIRLRLPLHYTSARR